MPILGAHMSIAGGYYKSVEIASQCTCDCVQLFTKNNNQWRAKPISDAEADRFRETLDRLKISHPISHASYLINLASPDDTLWSKSIDAMVVELERADRLGIPHVVVHPGSHTTSSEPEGIRRVIDGVNETLRRTDALTSGLLLENTAGQGTNLGWRFEQLAEMLQGIEAADRAGVCFDTCHAFAAGYAMGTEREFKSTFREFGKSIGIDRLKAFHLNDSKREFGSRVDRHEHIGEGHLGIEPFRFLLNDRRFARIPMYLETPKDKHPETGEEWDVVNLRTLRALVAAARKR